MTRRQEAGYIIAAVIKANPGVDTKELRKLANKAYPWGPRQHHPYEAWKQAMNDAFGPSPQKVAAAKLKRKRDNERLGRTPLFAESEP